MKFRFALVVALATSSPAFAADVEVGRRGFLGLVTGFIAGVTGKTPATPPAPAPAAVTEVTAMTTAARVARTDRLAGLIGRPLTTLTLSDRFLNEKIEAFRPPELEILDHYRAQAPRERAWVTERLGGIEAMDVKIAELRANRAAAIQQSSDQPRDEASAVAYAWRLEQLHEERDDIAREIRAGVSEWPWSSFDWSEVFAPQVVEAEQRTATRLGLGLEDVQQLTEQLLQVESYVHLDFPAEFKRTHLLAVLGSPNFDPNHPPLFSTESVSVLIEELERSNPELAKSWATYVSQERLSAHRAQIRESLARSAPNVTKYRDRFDNVTPLQVGFSEFDLYTSFGRRPLKPEWVLPRYGQLIAHLERVGRGLEAMNPSDFRTVAREEVDRLREALIHEAATLPVRVAYDNEISFSRSPAGKYSNAGKLGHWDESMAQVSALPREDAIRWARTLESVSAVARAFLPAAVSLLTELGLEIEHPAVAECASSLDGANDIPPHPPLQIEAKPDESLGTLVEETENQIPVEK